MRLPAAIVFAFGFLLALGALGALSAQQQQQQQQQQQDVRSQFRLPGLFNFAAFKATFDKHYGSLREELVRQKIFLGRAVQAFVSMVKYKYRRLSSYLALNQRSDRTPRELRASYVPAAQLAGAMALPESAVEEEDDHHEGDLMEELEEIPVANLAEVSQELVGQVESLSGQPGYRELASELRQVDLSTARETSPIEDIATRERAESNNPSYQAHPILFKSSEKEEQSLPASLVNALYSLPGANYVSNLVGGTARKLGAWLMENELADEEVFIDASDRLPDEVWTDLRESGCLTPVKRQGSCGSCYAFTAIALYEYLYCQATGKQVAFSEQYLVSCGHRERMRACMGGRMDLVADFVDTYGLELEEDFPYVGHNGTCPYPDHTSSIYMGYIKPRQRGSRWLDPSAFGDYLDKATYAGLPGARPIMFGIGTTKDFDFYGGGVDEALGCDVANEAHAMLIVGHGREDGREYYLFRNSYGPKWGERGHYKMSKEALMRCKAITHGVISAAKFNSNQEHDLNQLSPKLMGANRKRIRQQLEEERRMRQDDDIERRLEQLAKRNRQLSEN